MKLRITVLMLLAAAMLVLASRGPSYARSPRAIITTPPSPVVPGAGLLGTHHDWSADSSHHNATINPGLCSYCHTPHHAITTGLLWNQTLSKQSFSWDVPATTAGTTFPTFAGNTYGGPTAKCLSCHDGSVAVGDFNWFGEQGEFNGSPNPYAKYKITGDAQVGAGGSMQGQHPVAMPYPYGGVSNTYNGVANGLNTPTGDFTQFQTTPVSPVRLYSDVNGDGKVIVSGATAQKSGMECSSCHDPHNKIAKDDLFLVGTLSGNDTDYICLKCHIK